MIDFNEQISLIDSIHVVDIGANPIESAPPYQILIDRHMAHITGFEPQPEALAQLQAAAGPNDHYLPYIIGDGLPAQLYVTSYTGCTSTLKPVQDIGRYFAFVGHGSKVQETIDIQTVKLDEVAELRAIDFLKIDIQGGELKVFQNGKHKLADCLVIQTEVSFFPIYEQQPSFGEIDVELRAQGFIPLKFEAIKHAGIGIEKHHFNQLLEADMVYVRDFRRLDLLSTTAIKKMASIVHYCYGSYDVVMFLCQELERRAAIYNGFSAHYAQLLSSHFQTELIEFSSFKE